MSGLCKLLGHKWKGCVCVRCGQSRNKEHIWQFSAFASSRIHPIQCREKCELCGVVRDANHKWDDCVCSGCGRRRDSNHRLGPVKPLISSVNADLKL